MYYIQKEQNIQGTSTSIFYEGDHRWTTVFSERKLYNNQEETYIENVYNSAIFYPGKYLHCPGKYFGETLEDSRFVIVIFANIF